MTEVIHRTDDPLEAFFVSSAVQEEGKGIIRKLARDAQAVLDIYYHANISKTTKEEDLKEDLQEAINKSLEYADE